MAPNLNLNPFVLSVQSRSGKLMKVQCSERMSRACRSSPPSSHTFQKMSLPTSQEKSRQLPSSHCSVKLSVLNYLTQSNGWFPEVHNPDSDHWFLTFQNSTSLTLLNQLPVFHLFKGEKKETNNGVFPQCLIALPNKTVLAIQLEKKLNGKR